jgi:DNA-directed RNA polymerase subunit RPC12/RpoP
VAEPKEYELWSNDEIVCPYCGHVHGDSWEYGGDSECFEVDCAECEKKFDVTRNVSVTYTSSKLEKQDARP